MESKLDPIEKLVPMMDDTNHNIATLALAAIVNCDFSRNTAFPTTSLALHTVVLAAACNPHGRVCDHPTDSLPCSCSSV